MGLHIILNYLSARLNEIHFRFPATAPYTHLWTPPKTNILTCTVNNSIEFVMGNSVQIREKLIKITD